MLNSDNFNHFNKNTAVCLGFFDGVHKGHKAVIKEAVKQKKFSLIPVLFTFDTSPVLQTKNISPELITDNHTKSKILKNIGIEHVIYYPFSELKDLSPEEFVYKIILKKLKAKKVFCGFNYKFGKGGFSDSQTLKKLCQNYNITVEIVPPIIDDNLPISSTRIRSLIKSGKVDIAERLLERSFSFTSKVITGRKLGRKLGAPTLNQTLPKDLVVPKFGVYASLVSFKDITTCGVTNIGIKPTVGSEYPLSETFMPNYNGHEIYGEIVTIKLIKFLRTEQKFNNLDELKYQIISDAKNSQIILKNYKYL